MSEKQGPRSAGEIKSSRGLKGCPCYLKHFSASFKVDKELDPVIPSPRCEGVHELAPPAGAFSPALLSQGLAPQSPGSWSKTRGCCSPTPATQADPQGWGLGMCILTSPAGDSGAQPSLRVLDLAHHPSQAHRRKSRGPAVPSESPKVGPPIVGLAVAGHTAVTCPGDNKCGPAQTRPCLTGDSGLTLQPLTEITSLKVDPSTTVLEFSTREYCLEILRGDGTSLSVCPLSPLPPPHTLGDNEPFQMA